MSPPPPTNLSPRAVALGFCTGLVLAAGLFFALSGPTNLAVNPSPASTNFSPSVSAQPFHSKPPLAPAFVAATIVDPSDALQKACAQPASRRTEAITAVLVGHADRPSAILAPALRLFAAEPGLLSTCGGDFVVALVAHGNFSSVAPLAALAPADIQANWVNLTFHRWAADQPRAAFDALPLFPEAQRSTAFHALIEGWAAVHPAEATDYILTLPAGPEQDAALSTTLANLSLQDPASLSVRIAKLPPGPIRDRAAAALVLQADSVNRSPDVALRWAETISDPTLREKSLAHALRDIAKQNPAAALAYLRGSPTLTPGQRSQIERQLSGE